MLTEELLEDGSDDAACAELADTSAAAMPTVAVPVARDRTITLRSRFASIAGSSVAIPARNH